MKTQQEIDGLKHNWLGDPCWDIEDTEGFEDHKAELLAFRLEHEARWRRRVMQSITDSAERLKISLPAAEFLLKLEARVTALERGED